MRPLKLRRYQMNSWQKRNRRLGYGVMHCRIMMMLLKSYWTLRVLPATSAVALYQAQRIRKGFAARVSRSEIQKDTSILLTEVGEELTLVSPGLQAFFTERVSDLFALPMRLFDVHFLGRLFRSLFGLSLVILIWVTGRRYGQALVARIIERFLPVSEPILPNDRAALMTASQRLRVAVVDLFAATILDSFGPQELPELMLLLHVIFLVAAVRALMAVFDLVTAVEPSNRPALVRMSLEAGVVARQTVYSFLLWWATRSLAVHVSGELMNGYALLQLVQFFFVVLMFGLVVWYLFRWAPFVRERISRQPQESWLVRALSQQPSWRLRCTDTGPCWLRLYCACALLGLCFLVGPAWGCRRAVDQSFVALSIESTGRRG